MKLTKIQLNTRTNVSKYLGSTTGFCMSLTEINENYPSRSRKRFEHPFLESALVGAIVGARLTPNKCTE